MMAGHRPFYMKDEKLCLELKPILPVWLFDGDNRVSFNFLGNTRVTYHNPNRVNTYEGRAKKSTVILKDGTRVEFEDGVITEPCSSEIRAGRAESIEVIF
jgi:hypothetical protein